MPILIRPATAADRSEVAELICVSTNYWYQKRGASRVNTAENAAVFQAE